MTKLLVASAVLMLAQPALARTEFAISLVNGESAHAFADRRECEDVLTGRAIHANASSTAGRTGLTGAIYNRVRRHESRCERVNGEYLIVVRPTLDSGRPGTRHD